MLCLLLLETLLIHAILVIFTSTRINQREHRHNEFSQELGVYIRCLRPISVNTIRKECAIRGEDHNSLDIDAHIVCKSANQIVAFVHSISDSGG